MKLALTTAAALFTASSAFAAPTAINLHNPGYEVGTSPAEGWGGTVFKHTDFVRPNNAGLGAWFAAHSADLPGQDFVQELAANDYNGDTVADNDNIVIAANTEYTFSGFVNDGGPGGSVARLVLGYLDGSGDLVILNNGGAGFLAPAATNTWTEFTATLTVADAASGIGENLVVGWSGHSGGGGDVWIDGASATYEVIPEPGSLALLGLGGLALLRRRR